MQVLGKNRRNTATEDCVSKDIAVANVRFLKKITVNNPKFSIIPKSQQMLSSSLCTFRGRRATLQKDRSTCQWNYKGVSDPDRIPRYLLTAELKACSGSQNHCMLLGGSNSLVPYSNGTCSPQTLTIPVYRIDSNRNCYVLGSETITIGFGCSLVPVSPATSYGHPIARKTVNIGRGKSRGLFTGAVIRD